MKRLVALLTLLAPFHLVAQTPVVRAHLEPSGNIIVGQPVRLVVSVFVPNYFTGSPDFPEFEMENAIVVLPQDRPEHSNTRIGNETYFGITQTYVIYPQQPGSFHVPAAKFSVPYAIAPPRNTTAEVALPAVSFRADLPAAARDLPYFLPTTRLTIAQHFSRPLKGLQTGDTIERSITVTADKMQAMLIPPLDLEKPDGIRIYNGEPKVNDQKTPRGDFISGQRVQAAKYFIEKPGTYTLPAIQLTWWNLSTNKPVTATLPAVTFSAVPGPGGQTELPPPPEPVLAASAPAPKSRIHYRSLALRIVATLLVIVLILLAIWFARRWYPQFIASIERAKNSEAARFRALMSAARQNDAALTYARLLYWYSAISPGLPLDQRVKPESELGLAISHLAATLYASNHSLGAWTGDNLQKQLLPFRKRLRQSKHDASRSVLVPLNPTFRMETPRDCF